MPRTIHLATFSNGPRPAHFALFIPTGNAGEKGKLIQVDGNPATGFSLEFLRNYDFVDAPCAYQIIPLGEVNDGYVADTPGNGELSKDSIARDRLESVAAEVKPPGRSLNPFYPAAPNCQNWMLGYVQKLVEEGYIDSNALLVVQNTPRTLRDIDRLL